MTIPEILESLGKVGWLRSNPHAFLVIEDEKGYRRILQPNVVLTDEGREVEVQGAMAQDARWLYVFDRTGVVHRLLRDVREYLPGSCVLPVITAYFDPNDPTFVAIRQSIDGSSLLLDKGTSFSTNPYKLPKPPRIL